MTTLAQVKTGVYAWASAALGLTTIFADQAAPRPAYPYATLKVNGARRLGHDEVTAADSVTGDVTIRGQRESTLSVNVYGAGAADYLDTLISSVADPVVQATLNAAGLAVRNISGIRDLTAFQETAALQRAQADFSIGYQRSQSTDAGVIETIGIGLTASQPGLADITVTLEVDEA